MNFDPIDYFQTIQEELLELQGDYRFFRVTGLSHLEELLSNLRKVTYPVLCVDDTQDGFITEAGGCYYDSRYYSIFILSKVNVNDDADRGTKMAECRTVFRKILTRLVRDSTEFANELIYLHPDRIKYDEVGYIANNLFGIHFGFTIENPQDLVYDEDDWNT